MLKGAGLIQCEIDGPRTCYCAPRERVAELQALLGELLDESVELAPDSRASCGT